MASKKYYWLKLKRDFFKRHDIRIIEEMPNGKDYILFYLKLLLESIDHEGNLRFSDAIPYNEQMLSVVTNTNIDIVKAAMTLFIELKMIDIFDDETIYMNEVENLIGSETQWAEYKRNKKTSVKELPPLKVCKRISYESIQLPNGKVQYVDEKRYGCNGGLAFDRSGGKCEICGSEENLVIHHNNGYSNELEDLLICCKKCHGKLEKVQKDSKLLPIEKDKEKDKELDLELDVDVIANETDNGINENTENVDNSVDKQPLELLHGQLGKGVVLLTQAQMDALLDKLGLDSFNHYVERLANFIIKNDASVGNHYQTILSWAEQDSKV